MWPRTVRSDRTCTSGETVRRSNHRNAAQTYGKYVELPFVDNTNARLSSTCIDSPSIRKKPDLQGEEGNKPRTVAESQNDSADNTFTILIRYVVFLQNRANLPNLGKLSTTGGASRLLFCEQRPRHDADLSHCSSDQVHSETRSCVATFRRHQPARSGSLTPPSATFCRGPS